MKRKGILHIEFVEGELMMTEMSLSTGELLHIQCMLDKLIDRRLCRELEDDLGGG